ncbi:MAG: FimV/HubP family polar landmark protein, partial [Alphaproteobacteria bacterium]
GASESGEMEFNLDLGEGATPTAETGGDMDFSPDLGDTAAAEPASEASSDVDFNLDLEESPIPSTTEEVAAVDESGLDFNLDMGDSGGGEAAVGDAELDLGPGTEETASTAGEETDSLDFDLNLAGAGSDDTAEFNLDMATEADRSDTTMAIDPGAASSGELGLESSGATPEPTMDFEMDTAEGGDLDIGSSDEVGTKLDLAKAYIDMGDPDGARSILDEVLDEGTDSQKQEAQELLQQIA